MISADLVTPWLQLGLLVAGALVGVFVSPLLVELQEISIWLLPGIAAWALLIVAGFSDSIARLRRGTERRLGE